MNRPLRNVVLIVGVVSFLATTSGLVLYVHLSHVDEPAKHDPAHCPICQQLLISKKSFIAEIPAGQIEVDTAGRLVEICPTPPLEPACHRPAHPRAPPV